MITDIVIRMDALAAKGFRIGGTFSSVIVSCFDNAFDREKAALIMKYVLDKNAGRR